MTTITPNVSNRRVSTFFRRVRELGGSRASSARVEPGPSAARTWGLIGLGLVWATCLLALAGWGGGMISGIVRWEHLRSRGVNTMARVDDTQTDNSGDNPAYYLSVFAPECSCDLVVRVTTLNDHPVGSNIPVRYDPRDHSNALSLADRPMDWLGVGAAGFVATSVAATVLALNRWRAYRRRKSSVHTYTEKTPVKFRVWRRTFGNSKVHYLVLYDAATSTTDEPLCCVPVSFQTLRKLRADDVLVLYGNGARASAVLSREETIIVPRGHVKPGRWEQSLRLS